MLHSASPMLCFSSKETKNELILTCLTTRKQEQNVQHLSIQTIIDVIACAGGSWESHYCNSHLAHASLKAGIIIDLVSK